MTRELRLALVLAPLLVAAAGCGYQTAASEAAPTAAPAAPSPDAVQVQVVCGGAQQVFWQGSWWFDPTSLRPVRGNSFDRSINATMTVTGPGQAVLSSPDLVGPQTMVDSHVNQPGQPPLGSCDPL